MKRAACDRRWQVEAARDGRLTASASAALSQHMTSCQACQAEQRALERLAQTLQETELDIDDVALRRLRQQTLEKANAALLQPASASSRFWTLGAAVAVCTVLAAAALLGGRLKSESPPASAVLVLPDANAKWQRNLDSDVEHVDLTAGTLLFRVARGPADRRLIVRVPDGEIEDLGTTFSVTVQDGKTTEVVVREGRVLFHRRGASALQLVAGSSWTPTPELAAPSEFVKANEPRTPELALAPESEQPPVTVETSQIPAKRTRTRGATHRPVPPARTIEATGEDEAYLHMLALLREGRAAEARLAAHAYLRAFPSGFRHVEVTRVADARDAAAKADDEPE